MSDDYVPSDDDLIWSDQDLDGCETYEPSAFFAAIRAADRWRNTAASIVPKKTENGDMTRLVEFLLLKLEQARSDKQVIMDREEFALLIDLLWRHKLVRRPGEQRDPIYREASWTDLQLELVAQYVRYYQSTGLTFADAVDRVVDQDQWIDAEKKEALILYMRGRLHPDRGRLDTNAETLIRRIRQDFDHRRSDTKVKTRSMRVRSGS
jgi:hypothetical protein